MHRQKSGRPESVLFQESSAVLTVPVLAGNAFNGTGKSKFGFGVNLSERADHALLYAEKIHRAKPGDGCFVCKVEVPALAPGNRIWIKQPVEPEGTTSFRDLG